MRRYAFLIFQILTLQVHAIGVFTINCEYDIAKCTQATSTINSYRDSEEDRVGHHYSPDETSSRAIGNAINSANQQFDNIFSELGDASVINGSNLSSIITQIGSNYTAEQQQLFINNILSQSLNFKETSVIQVTPYLTDIRPVQLTSTKSVVFNNARLKASGAISQAIKSCEGKSCSATSLQVTQNILNGLINTAINNNINADYLNRWSENTSFADESQQEFEKVFDNLQDLDLDDAISALQKQRDTEKKIKAIASEWDMPLDSVEIEKQTTPLEEYANEIIELKNCLQDSKNCSFSDITKTSSKYENEYKQIENIYRTARYIHDSSIESHYKDSAKGFLNLSTDSLIGGDSESSKQFEEIATSVVDIGLGLIPVVSVGKDVYELISGKNLITGEELSTFDRSMAAVGILSIGSSHYVQATARALSKFGIVSKVINKGTDIVNSARKSGLFSGSKFKELKSNTSYETVKSFFRELDGKVTLPIKKSLVKSFDLKTIRENVLDKDLIVYRWHNNDDAAKRLGRFVSDTPLSDKDAARRLLALPSSNKMLVMEKYKIPKGTKIFGGKVAPFNAHPGGGSQIFITGQDINKLLIPILD